MRSRTKAPATAGVQRSGLGGSGGDGCGRSTGGKKRFVGGSQEPGHGRSDHPSEIDLRDLARVEPGGMGEAECVVPDRDVQGTGALRLHPELGDGGVRNGIRVGVIARELISEAPQENRESQGEETQRQGTKQTAQTGRPQRKPPCAPPRHATGRIVRRWAGRKQQVEPFARPSKRMGNQQHPIAIQYDAANKIPRRNLIDTESWK